MRCFHYLHGHGGEHGRIPACSGAKGKRLALPNSEVMIHQPSGGMQGQATDMEITTRHIIKTKERLNKILAANTGKPMT